MIFFVVAALAGTLPAAESFRLKAVVLDTVPRIVLLPEPGSGLVSSQWLFGEGADDDDAAAFGLAHLVEHLSFGSIAEGTGEDYDSRLGALGGLSDGWTDRERAGFGASVAAEGAKSGDALLRLELHRATHLNVSEAAIERQRSVIQEELAEANDAAHGADRVWLSQLLWNAGEPWSRHPQGTPRERVRPADVLTRWRELVERGVLVLAGEFDAPRLRALAEGLLPASGPLTAPAGPELGEPGCEPAAPSTRWVQGNGRRGTVYVAWPVPGRSHRDRVALEALARWVGGARLAVGAGCGEWVVERGDTWLALPYHRASILRALRQVAVRGLDDASLDRVRADAVADYARALGSLPLRARVAGSCVLAGRAVDCASEEVDAWLHLTGADLARAAGRWLLPDGSTTLAVLPPGTRLAPWIPGVSPWSPP